MSRYSKVIARLVEDDDRLDEYWHDSDGHWVVLCNGFERQGFETQMIHEWSVREVIMAIRNDIVEVENPVAMLSINAKLIEALEILSDEAPNSVEYSDWPELQKAVRRARTVLAKAKKLLLN